MNELFDQKKHKNIKELFSGNYNEELLCEEDLKGAGVVYVILYKYNSPKVEILKEIKAQDL